MVRHSGLGQVRHDARGRSRPTSGKLPMQEVDEGARARTSRSVHVRQSKGEDQTSRTSRPSGGRSQGASAPARDNACRISPAWSISRLLHGVGRSLLVDQTGRISVCWLLAMLARVEISSRSFRLRSARESLARVSERRRPGDRVAPGNDCGISNRRETFPPAAPSRGSCGFSC